MVDFKKDDLDDAHIVPRKIHLKGTVPLQKAVDDKLLNDQDPKTTTIICINCREPLFKVTVKTELSHKVESLGPWKYKNNDNECPRCHGDYFLMESNGRPKILTSKGWM